LEIVLANTKSIIQRILPGEMDLGMVGNLPQEHSRDLEVIVYVKDEIVLIASPSHPLAQAGRISLKDVAKEGIIVREQGSATRRTAEGEFESLECSPSIALEQGSNQAVKQAASGDGVGVISRLGVEAEVKAGILSVLDVSGWDCRRPLTVIYAKDRYLAPAQIAFRQFLLDRREGALTPGPSP
jgi:DNA-binding transcriptional LysR family regulator